MTPARQILGAVAVASSLALGFASCGGGTGPSQTWFCRASCKANGQELNAFTYTFAASSGSAAQKMCVDETAKTNTALRVGNKCFATSTIECEACFTSK